MKQRNDVNAHLATCPLLHPCRCGFVFEIIVGNDVRRPQALEISFDIGKVVPKEARIEIGSSGGGKTHLFRMRLIVFNPRSLARVITACPTCTG